MEPRLTQSLRRLVWLTLSSAVAFTAACRTQEPVAVQRPYGAPYGQGAGQQPYQTQPQPQPQPQLASYPTGPSAFQNLDPKRNPPQVSARAAIVVQANTGKVLYQKNADTRVPVASTQKLLLGLLVAERGGLGQRVTVQSSDTHCEPTVMGIRAGQTYTRGELLRTVLIRSSNDIARCLARDHSGSDSAFAAAMTRRARQLGMNNSYFTNSNGLPDPPGQFSTARDLSILAAACMRHSAIRDAVDTASATFRFSDGRTVPLTNTNKVLRSFPYCTGMKTGYTNAAGRCLVSSASHNGKNVIVVILGSQTPTVWTESQALLQWGLGM